MKKMNVHALAEFALGFIAIIFGIFLCFTFVWFVAPLAFFSAGIAIYLGIKCLDY